MVGGGRKEAGSYARIAALAVVLALTAAVTASAAVTPVEVPEVTLPPVPAPLPQVPAPAPPPVPAVEVPLPVPVPVPVAPPVAPPALAPSAAPRLESSPTQLVGAGAALAAAAPGASDPGERTAAGDKHGARRGGGYFGTRYRKPRRLVRGLRGCLDEIGALPRRLLILRYGIGGYEPRRAAHVAQRLELSRRRYALVRRRGLRQLVMTARGSRCEHEGLAVSAIMIAADTGGAIPAAPATVAQAVSSTGAGTPSGAPGGVLGRSESDQPDENRSGTRIGVPNLDLASPASDLPFLLAVVGLSSLFAWLVYKRARAARDQQQYEHDSV